MRNSVALAIVFGEVLGGTGTLGGCSNPFHFGPKFKEGQCISIREVEFYKDDEYSYKVLKVGKTNYLLKFQFGGVKTYEEKISSTDRMYHEIPCSEK